MPRKPGIFTRYQNEILSHLEQGVGYTEISEILKEKHGIKTTKQNLQRSHKRFLKNAAEALSKSKSKTRRKRAQKVPHKGHTKERSSGAKNKLSKTTDPNVARKQIAGLFLELRALLDRELSTARFSDIQAHQLGEWGKLLSGIHAQTCVDVFQACHGGDFSSYQEAVFEAMERIENERLYEPDKSLDPTPAEFVSCLCSWVTEEGEVTTLKDRIPNLVAELKASRQKVALERERLGEDGFISL